MLLFFWGKKTSLMNTLGMNNFMSLRRVGITSTLTLGSGSDIEFRYWSILLWHNPSWPNSLLKIIYTDCAPAPETMRFSGAGRLLSLTEICLSVRNLMTSLSRRTHPISILLTISVAFRNSTTFISPTSYLNPKKFSLGTSYWNSIQDLFME